MSTAFEPIKILEIIDSEITQPRNDGTRGSALYAVPFRLSAKAPYEWCELFVRKWNSPPEYTSMHRPGIARAAGDRVVLDGTTVEEVASVHKQTLILVVDETNRTYAEYADKKAAAENNERARREEHDKIVRETAKKIKFD